tara:strand:- start:36 stop:233 length:198 start_codon:yes stop_codon:yes gene_type:complete
MTSTNDVPQYEHSRDISIDEDVAHCVLEISKWRDSIKGKRKELDTGDIERLNLICKRLCKKKNNS